jgi:hypothetical protein
MKLYESVKKSHIGYKKNKYTCHSSIKNCNVIKHFRFKNDQSPVGIKLLLSRKKQNV